MRFSICYDSLIFVEWDIYIHLKNSCATAIRGISFTQYYIVHFLDAVLRGVEWVIECLNIYAI